MVTSSADRTVEVHRTKKVAVLQAEVNLVRYQRQNEAEQKHLALIA